MRAAALQRQLFPLRDPPSSPGQQAGEWARAHRDRQLWRARAQLARCRGGDGATWPLAWRAAGRGPLMAAINAHAHGNDAPRSGLPGAGGRS